MESNSISLNIPWWMNPRYPMGRWDYFKTSLFVIFIGFLSWLVACFAIGLLIGYLTQDPSIAEKITEENLLATLYPFLLIQLPLNFRRARAAKIPFQVIWFTVGLDICDLAISPDFTIISFITGCIYLWVWIAPNRMEVISSNPDTMTRR